MSGHPGTLSRSLLALSVALLTVSPIYAPTWTVCASGCDYTSIQDAVDDADSGDTLQLSAETFVENVSIIEKDIQILGAGPDRTVVDGGAVGSVFFLDLHQLITTTCCGPRGCFPCREDLVYSVTLSGLTIRNGADELGGGVEQLSGRLAVDDCVIENNTAESGGGILAQGAYLQEGFESLDIENSVIRENLAVTGGGIHVDELSTVITTTTVSGNSGSPSAISFYSAYYPLNLNRSIVNGNVGDTAIASGAAGTTSISTTTISGNTGTGVQGWRTYVSSSTITGNGYGISGVYYLQTKNSIVAGNNQADCALLENVRSEGHNLLGSSCIHSGSWDPNPTDVEVTDSLLLPLADNGGPTLTHALRLDSAAIDAGSDHCRPTDQRGVPRPQDGDGDGMARCDIGAFELIRPDPVALLGELIEQVASLHLHHGIENSLLAKLNAAALILGDLQPDNDHAAANILGAFVHHVEAQRGKKISAEEADALIDAADEIVELLGADSEISRPGLRSRTFPRGGRLGSTPREPE